LMGGLPWDMCPPALLAGAHTSLSCPHLDISQSIAPHDETDDRAG
jgi:hypothetical protein